MKSVMAEKRGVVASQHLSTKIIEWLVGAEEDVEKDDVIARYQLISEKDAEGAFHLERKLKAKCAGRIIQMLIQAGETASPGCAVLEMIEEQCTHKTVMKEMCCDCGADLRKDPLVPGDLIEPIRTAVPMVHNIPELIVSAEEATRIAKQDEKALLRTRKLALVVDLDQTLIHTTVDPVLTSSKDMYHFQLPGKDLYYHTKFRPGAKQFLETVSKLFELHVFTMGSRMYAHTIVKFLDPSQKLFAHRIRSRDECFNPFTKSQDLRALFPCGDHMVCIIDDREDVWHSAPNLVAVKPYRFFTGIGDINTPGAPLLNQAKVKNPPFGKPASDEKTLDENTDKNSVEAKSDEKPENADADLKTEIPDENTGTENSDGNSTTDYPEKNFEKETVESKENLESVSDKNVNGDTSIEDSISEGRGSKPKENGKEIQNTDDSNAAEKNIDVDVPIDNSVSEKAVNTDHQHEDSYRDPIDLDDHLFYLEDILQRIHMTFYSTLDAIKEKGGTARSDHDIIRYCTQATMNPDVRCVVPQLRFQTLNGVSIVFTGVIPVHVPIERSSAFKIAVALGARVTKEITLPGKDNLNERTTHVVAARRGTEKAYIAEKCEGIKLVNPDWLWCCYERWEWVNEELFPVPDRGQEYTETPPPSRRGTPQRLGQENVDQKSLSISPLTNAPTDEDIMSVLNPLTNFSKAELDEMDKEVEDFMQSDEGSDENCDADDEEGNLLGSVSESSDSQEVPLPQMKHIRRKRKHDNELGSDQKPQSKKSLLSDDLERNVIEIDSSSNSSSSSSTESSGDDTDTPSEDESTIVAMLDRQISDECE